MKKLALCKKMLFALQYIFMQIKSWYNVHILQVKNMLTCREEEKSRRPTTVYKIEV
jgi:hypothetical protein